MPVIKDVIIYLLLKTLIVILMSPTRTLGGIMYHGISTTKPPRWVDVVLAKYASQINNMPRR